VGADATALRTVAGANGVGELVVGLPLDMSGGEGRAAEAARAWAVAIAEATGLPVALRDERLSSHVAEGRVGPAKRGPSGGPPGPARRAANRARIDREAARVILEDELTARALGSPGEWIMPRTRPAPAVEAAQAGSGTLVPCAQERGDGTAGASTIPVPGPGSHEDGA
jgi:putative transcription antitermination factor YqgF